MTNLKKEIIENMKRTFPYSKELTMLETAVEQALSSQKQEDIKNEVGFLKPLKYCSFQELQIRIEGRLE